MSMERNKWVKNKREYIVVRVVYHFWRILSLSLRARIPFLERHFLRFPVNGSALMIRGKSRKLEFHLKNMIMFILFNTINYKHYYCQFNIVLIRTSALGRQKNVILNIHLLEICTKM